MDTPSEALYNLRVEMFELEGGFKIWEMWNPRGTTEEYEYEKELWMKARKAEERELKDPVDAFQDLLRGINESAVRKAAND